MSPSKYTLFLFTCCQARLLQPIFWFSNTGYGYQPSIISILQIDILFYIYNVNLCFSILKRLLPCLLIRVCMNLFWTNHNMASFQGLTPRIFWGLTTSIKGNINYVSDLDVLYPAGGVLVIHNYVQMTQFYIKLPEPQKVLNIICVSPNK